MIAGLENKFEESLKLNKRTDIENRIITRRYIQEAQYVTNKNVEEVQKGNYTEHSRDKGYYI